MKRGIRVGPGRGSAAGSCVAYCLRIVDIDPIRYDLLFERFLNPGRKQMPDIDMDFDSRYRGDMIRYAAERYGDDHVAQIITFSTIKARAAVRDAGPRARLSVLRRRQDRQADAAAHHGSRHATRGLPRDDSRSTRTATRWPPSSASSTRPTPTRSASIDVARGLEGLRRQDGIHAAAVVITREPLTEYLPIQRKPQEGGDLTTAPVVTQYEMHGVEELGLLKMDFLGLRNLDVLEVTLDLVEATTGTRPDIDGVPLDDEKTFDDAPPRATPSASSSSKAGRCARCCARWRRRRSRTSPRSPRCTAPARWPRTGTTSTPTARTAGRPVTYPHPDLEQILAPTYGLMIYQEQLMRVAQQLAGYSLEDADNLRKATGKKDRELIASERTQVRRGMRRPGPRPRRSARTSSTRSSRSPTTRSTSRTRSATGTSRTRPPT